MAITMFDRLALGFADAPDCSCGTGYCQPYEKDDSIVLEGTISPLVDENLLQNGPFNTPITGPDVDDYWSVDEDWQIVGQQLVATNPLATTQAVYQKGLGLRAGHIYAITIEATVIGSQTAGLGFALIVNDEYMIFKDPVNSGKYLPDGSGYSAALTATWIYIPTAITTDSLRIRRVGNSGSFGFQILNLQVREVSIPAVASVDDEGNVLTEIETFNDPNERVLLIDGLEIDIAAPAFVNPVQSAPNFNSKNRIFIDIDDVADMNWVFRIILGNLLAFETGCQYIRVYDILLTENLIKNGTFTGSLNFWAVGDGWSYNANRAEFTAGPTPPHNNGQLLQRVYVPLWGGVYNFEFTVQGLGIGQSLEAYYDTGAGEVLIAEVTTNGSHNFDINTDTFDQDVIQLIDIYFAKGSLLLDITLDDVSFKRKTPDDSNQSNCINIQLEQSCTLLFAGQNSDCAFVRNVDALGYTYDNSGILRELRVYSKKKYSGYPEEKSIFKFSDNSNRTMFANSQKEWIIDIGDAAEHIHDLLSILRLMDAFTIEAVEYTPSSEYDLKARKTSDNSQASFLVREKQGISSNYSCS